MRKTELTGRRNRRSVTGLCLFALLTACSSGDDADRAPDSNAPTPEPTTDAGGDDASVPSVTAERPAAGPVERVTVDGLTFQYPTELFADLRESGADEVGETPSVEVSLFGLDDDTASAIVSAQTITDERGAFLDATSQDDRDKVAMLEADLDGDATGEVLEFANGSGVRSADDTYMFEGLTTSGGQLVTITATLDAADIGGSTTVELLDAMTKSVFVDDMSDALAPEACEPGVDIVSEVELESEAAIGPGELVTASWRVRNTGTCAWRAGDAWVFTGGDPVNLLEGNAVNEQVRVAVGEETNVTVAFAAPADPGRYAVQFQYQPFGQLDVIGPPVAILFEVG